MKILIFTSLFLRLLSFKNLAGKADVLKVESSRQGRDGSFNLTTSFLAQDIKRPNLPSTGRAVQCSVNGSF